MLNYKTRGGEVAMIGESILHNLHLAVWKNRIEKWIVKIKKNEW